MGCYWRNVSQSLRWGNIERWDPSPITRSRSLLIGWKQVISSPNESFQVESVVFNVNLHISLVSVLERNAWFQLCWSLLLRGLRFFLYICIMVAHCVQAALKPYCADSCAFELTAESIIYFLYFSNVCVSLHYIKLEITAMRQGKNNVRILLFPWFI